MPSTIDISLDLQTAWSPDEVIRHIDEEAERFRRFGYKIEERAPSRAVLTRRYTPTVAWAAPLVIAAIVFAVGVAGPNATAESADSAGAAARWCVLAALVLAFLVKANDRVILNASPDPVGSRVVVSGTATPALRRYLLTWGASEKGEN